MELYEEIKVLNKVHYTTAVIELSGEVIDGVTLQDLQKQAGDENDFETLIVEIASPGGSVSEGLMIMFWFDQLSQQGKKVITIVTANAYSIASLIMQAAHYRIISKHGKIMVHNPMIPELKYANADKLLEYASQLRELESTLYSLYQVFTGLDVEEIKKLMDNETYISPEDAKKYGFVDEVIDIKKRSYEMTTVKFKKINMSKALNILNRAIAKVTQAKFVNQFYYIAEGGEIEIFQKDLSTYALKDRTNLENGKVKIADGATLTIENFVIENIEKGVDQVAENTEADKVEAEVEAVVSEDEEPKNEEVEEEVINQEEESETPEETPEETPIIEPEKDSEKEMLIEAISKLSAVVDFLKDRIAELESKNSKMEADLVSIKSVQVASVEAIDEIATKTVSTFKPTAKKVEEKINSGSIFDNLKIKAGLIK